MNKGITGVDHLTSNGEIRIKRRVYWKKGEGTDDRMDRWLGIADRTVSKERLRRKRMFKGYAERYKEFKIGAFYDQAKDHQYVFGTAGNHEVLGRLLRQTACRLNAEQADQARRTVRAPTKRQTLDQSHWWDSYWDRQRTLAA